MQHNVINGICAGRKCVFWASHSEAIASARWGEGMESGNPKGVRSVRPSSVIVYHDKDDSSSSDDESRLLVSAARRER